jgi:hypothetical protein
MMCQQGGGLLKNTSFRQPLALRNSGMTRFVSLQIGLFQQARGLLTSVTHWQVAGIFYAAGPR